MRLTEGRLGRICMSKPLGSTFPGGFFDLARECHDSGSIIIRFDLGGSTYEASPKSLHPILGLYT